MKLLLIAALAVTCRADKLAPNHHAPSNALSSGGGDFLDAPNLYNPPQNNYLPPQNSYLPPNRPQRPQNSYLPPQNNYFPPEKPQNTYLPPQNTYKPPTNSYRPPTNTYRPPPQNTWKPPTNNYKPPQNTYLPPQNTYVPSKPSPQRPPANYLPPQNSYRPPQNSYVPPQYTNRPQNTYLPPRRQDGYDQGPYHHQGSDFLTPELNSKPVIPILDQENSLGPDGSYRYSFTGADRTHVEQEGHLENIGTPLEGQVVTGSYEYVGDDGINYKVTYIADKDGYRATGKHLPTSPPIPKEIQRALAQNAAEEAARASQGNGYPSSSGYPSSQPSNQYLPPRGSFNDGYY